MNGTPKDIDPASDLREEDEEQALPELEPAEAPAGTLAAGRAAIARAIKHAPAAPGVYRMIDAQGEVLYVGKAKNIKKRVIAYTRPTGHDSRIVRMISGTVTMEFVTTKTETEALLLEANLIKRLRPRFNVLLRDDKSFPFILITRRPLGAADLEASRRAFAGRATITGRSPRAGAVNRTINALQRAFLLRSCSDSFFEARTRPCLLYQIKRCSAPCTSEIDFAGYTRTGARGQRIPLRPQPAGAEGARRPKWTRRRRRSISSAPRSIATVWRRCRRSRRTRASIRAALEEADVFAVHQAGGYTCVEVFFFRTGQNWGNRAYFPKADRALGAGRGAGRVPGAVLRRQAAAAADAAVARHSRSARCWPRRSPSRAAARSRSRVPQRGERKELVQHALANAREALARKLADTSSQQKLLKALARDLRAAAPAAPHRGLRQQPHQGTNAVGAMMVAGPEGFRKNQYRKFNIRSAELAPGDDYGMMREVLQRRFKRLLEENPRALLNSPARGREEFVAADEQDEHDEQPWPDLVLIDGGQGQLATAQETLSALGVTGVPLVAIAKGPDRDAGRETFFMAGRRAVQAAAARPVALFHRAVARRGAPLRHRLAPRAPQARHPRGRIAGNSGDRAHPQARAAAPFRHLESDRTREPARSRPGARN